VRQIYLIIIIILYSCVDSVFFLNLSKHEVCAKEIWNCLKANPACTMDHFVETFLRENPSKGNMVRVIYSRVVRGLMEVDTLYNRGFREGDLAYLRNEINTFREWNRKGIIVNQVSDLMRSNESGEVVRKIEIMIRDEHDTGLNVLWIEENPVHFK
jgi:hypothetical protein